jgi:hypothetical protein
MHTDYNVAPFKSSEETHDGMYNMPPVIRFDEKGPSFMGPPPTIVKALSHRGPGDVTTADARPKFEALKGGKPDQPDSGKASTTVEFSQPGDYVLHVTANDDSGNGGGGSGCCWTTAMIRVGVKAADSETTGAR